eukprot:CAMPEP_0170167102 /NCGR_PEP_ID=MMETSP0040_2-20121228/602_1 /TAXON_ID=641309 /ORGANISM="Lotharella oceanica, Strain CCMP622" /LENGTH=110 /DNA_ID=CAMNT_0010405021 /DNA_START=39 /DNA_END=371 /DNA_ORIENTATION=-
MAVHLPKPPDYAKKFLKKTLQPHNGHYGGMGLAKPSVWITLKDPEISEKFRMVYNQHVDGFGGKSYNKVSKKKNKNKKGEVMLWRQRLAEKQSRDAKMANKNKKKRRRTK